MSCPSSRLKSSQVWSKRVYDWQASSRSMAAWCREHNFNYHQFLYWKVRLLGRKKDKITPSGFVEVNSPSRTTLVIEVQGLRLVIPQDFDETTLVRCLRALKKC